MAVGRCGQILSGPKIQVPQNSSGREVERLQNRLLHGLRRHGLGPVGIHIDRDRLHIPDGIGQLNCASSSQTGSDHIWLPSELHRRRNGPLLSGLYRKRHPSVRAAPPVRIHNDFASGHPTVCGRASKSEGATGIDETGEVLRPQLLRDHRMDDALDDFFSEGFQVGRKVLGGEDDFRDSVEFPVLVADRYLAFGIGQKSGKGSRFPHLCVVLHQAVGDMNGDGNKLSVSSVAYPNISPWSPAPTFPSVWSPCRGFGGLPSNQHAEVRCFGAEPRGCVHVSISFSTSLARAGRSGSTIQIVHLSMGFSCDGEMTRSDQGFNRRFSAGVLTQDQVDNGTGNLVGDLVGMSLAYGFRCKIGTVLMDSSESGVTRGRVNLPETKSTHRGFSKECLQCGACYSPLVAPLLSHIVPAQRA